MKTYSTGQDQSWQSESGAVSVDQWTCFEFEVDVGASTSHLYMNDADKTHLFSHWAAAPTDSLPRVRHKATCVGSSTGSA
jgi:hypothetical protein